jgi:dTDP-4-amino-4,6-dideoxygalactose transaminase
VKDGHEMERINVTRSYVPPIEEYEEYLKAIWSRAQLTNNGPLLREFEVEASRYLGVNNFQFVSNGTIALQLALHSLGMDGGEVITTPFSYVATTSAILWERFTPVFVDIRPDTFCIDAAQIEAAITPATKAILAVHVFGNPCDVEEIERIAAAHHLTVIYDGAHAFGVNYQGRSLLDYGDISTCSFHATKLFHTIEGGCVIARDDRIDAEVDLAKRFGHNADEHISLGINAKSSEFQAAMGLCNLGHIDEIIADRGRAIDRYKRQLGDRFQLLKLAEDTEYNNAYFPVVLQNEEQLVAVIDTLNENNVFPRRYFYPSLNSLPYLNSTALCPISDDISSRILCLPMFVGLDDETIDGICGIMTR